jgi:GNAT superfamily N-acetyltransferase
MTTPPPALRVEPERSSGAGHKADRAAFIDLPYRLYAGHPVWIPPLRMAERDLMNAKKNPFFEHAEVQHFLARRGDRVVGRIAAIENRLHNEIHEDRIGFFGFFDVEPDPEAARGLLAAARSWTEARGLSPMRGPACYSMNDTCGLLVEGFEEAPRILMPYNRPDYESLLLDAGLVPVKDLLAFWLRVEDDVPERFRRVVARRLERRGVTLRDIDVSSTAAFRRDVATIKDLYNRCWEKNWSFVQATSAEFDHAAKDLKMLLVPEVSCIVEREGQPVGFSVFIRDLNVLLKGTSGRLTPRLLWRLLTGLKKVRDQRCVLLGVVPEARGNAINEAMFIRAFDRAREHGFAGAEAGWVLADNAAMTSPIEASGARIAKRYRMFETR